MDLQMPPQRDSHGQEEQEFSSSGSEKSAAGTPGVYTRSGDRPRNELDTLWSGSKPYAKEDRSPYLFLGVGVVIGAVLASAVFFLLFNKPEIQGG